MTFSKENIEGLSELAKIKLTEDEIKFLQNDLEKSLEHIDKIKEIELP